MQQPYPDLRYRPGLRRLRLRFVGAVEQLCHAIKPPGGLAGYFRAGREHATNGSQAGPTLMLTWRQKLRDGGEAGLGLQQQHEKLLAYDRLELCQRETRALIVR